MSIEVLEHGEVPANPEVHRYTPEELSQFAKDYHADKIFGSWMIRDSDISMLGMVFMPLFFMDEITSKQLQNSGSIFCFEYYDKAGPRGINGNPIFYSMRIICKDDLQQVLDKAKKIDELLKSI
jgi:hypothetical protein